MCFYVFIVVVGFFACSVLTYHLAMALKIISVTGELAVSVCVI